MLCYSNWTDKSSETIGYIVLVEALNWMTSIDVLKVRKKLLQLQNHKTRF